MPKKYSPRFLVELNNLDEEKLGVRLAKACVNADLPITDVAKVFGVSRMTIHSWFR
jgi:transposase